MILRIPVKCHHCDNYFEKKDALVLKNPQNKELYQCFTCFKTNKAELKIDVEKIDLYCEKCNYKFISNKLRCPYCNEFEFVIKSNVKLKDLL